MKLNAVQVVAYGDPRSQQGCVAAFKRISGKASLQRLLPAPTSPAPADAGAALALGASLPAEHILLWPASLPPDPATAKALLANTAGFDWVLFRCDEGGALARLGLRTAMVPSGLNLGAPSLLRTKALRAHRGSLGPGDPLALVRLARSFHQAGAGMGCLDPAPSLPTDSLSVIGVDRASLKRELQRRAGGMALGVLLVTLGVRLGSPALLALSSFGIGILILGYSFGRRA